MHMRSFLACLSGCLLLVVLALSARPAAGQGRFIGRSGDDRFRLAAFADPQAKPAVPGAPASVPLDGTDAGEGEAEDEGGIADNSFMIEEAYNQEPGVVQHIFNFVPAWDSCRGLRTRTFDFVFTQEWPVFSQRHQFSYTIPILWSRETFQGETFEAQGFGDILLNYRYQLLGGSGDDLAIAPRFSVILPIGEENEGFGLGKVGYQINLPASKEFERWAFHANAGLTVTPGVTAGVDPLLAFTGRTLNGYNAGASAIRKVRPNFHLMLECAALWDENLLEHGGVDRGTQVILNPGFRWAPYTEGETQWVLGLGVPVGLSRDAPDVAAFFYMSFEHRFQRKTECP
jgi:hypothetical protein